MPMIPTRSDLTLTRGDYFERYYRFETFVWDPDAVDADHPDGQYVSDGWRDLTGIEFKAQIRHQFDDTQVLAEFAFTVGDQTDEATKGGVLMYLDAVQAAALPLAGTADSPDKHVWDFQMTLDAKPETRFAGKVAVKPDVTRPGG